MRLVTVARKPVEGTTVGNVLVHGCGGIDIERCRVGDTKDVPASPSRTRGSSLSGSVDGSLRRETGQEDGHNPNIGRWPPNVVVQGLAVAASLDGQSGITTSGPLKPVDAANWKSKPFDDGRGWNSHSMHGRGQVAPQGYGDTGGASRFFKVMGS